MTLAAPISGITRAPGDPLWIDLEELFSPGSSYAITLKGDSFSHLHLADGDALAVKIPAPPKIEIGSLVVYQRQDGGHDIGEWPIPSDVSLVGVVIGMIRGSV